MKRIVAKMKNWHQYNFGPFVLGTAQLGLPYGIANQTGQPAYDKAKEIIDTAWKLGIRSFDTAKEYGSSEQILGKCLQNQSKEALIITKLSVHSFTNEATLLADTDNCLAILKCDRLFALLAHSSAMLKEIERIGRLFKAIKNTGKVLFTGISVYSPEEALLALESSHFDLIQMPLNAFDLRPVKAQLISKAEKQNKLLLFRSIFLQGLLLINPNNGLPPQVEFARPTLKKWWQVCQDLSVPPKTAAVQIAKQLASPFPLIIGAESAAQIKENIALLNMPLPQLDELLSLMAPISESCTEQLINPSLWQKR